MEGGRPAAAKRKAVPLDSSPSKAKDDDLRAASKARLIHDEVEALAHYDSVIAREKSEVKEGMEDPGAGGAGGADARRSKSRRPSKKLSPEMRQLYIQAQLNALPTFTPWFIRLVSFAQLVIMLLMMSFAYRDSRIASIGLSSSSTVCSVSPPSDPECPTTFECDTICYDTSAVRTSEVNPWVGPDKNFLLSYGAKYTPCMRRDNDITTKLQNERLIKECGANGVVCEGGGFSAGFGMSCCCVTNTTFCGMTNKTYCDTVGGTWLSKGGQNMLCSEVLNIVLRPCCLGRRSSCELLTETQCFYRKGVWHTDKQLCSQTMCLSGVCDTVIGGFKLQPDSSKPNEASSNNQWFRLFTCLLIHAGVVHFVLCCGVQYYVGKQIEKTAGWIRIALIYLISGVGGWVVSGIFSPYTVDMGADPAIFGMLGGVFVKRELCSV